MTKDNLLRKEKLRSEILSKRNQLTLTYVNQASASISKSLNSLYPLQKAQQIMAYAAYGKEVNLDDWIKTAQHNKKTILLPRVGTDNNLEAVPFESWELCSSGPFGIREPLGAAIDLKEIEAVLVPGLVFDRFGYRIGYGKGYYDRFLPQLGKHTFLCGVCFEFQLVASIDPEPYDFPVHWIVTDRFEVAINNCF